MRITTLRGVVVWIDRRKI